MKVREVIKQTLPDYMFHILAHIRFSERFLILSGQELLMRKFYTGSYLIGDRY